ncbi:MAG: alpha-amylase family protein [Sphaerochaetaceae bacterium]|nr:alpha-amylase family protein [Sphaerochaetaceae bacterium]
MDKSKWNEEFLNRFNAHEEELRYLYCELYHNDMQAYEYFVSMLYRLWSDRPENLKMIDRAREAEPDWYKGNTLTGMLMYVNAFAGNLKGVKEKLDYIEDCGVNYLHLMPLLESPEGRSDGGYAVSNFRKVQKELGTMRDLQSLATACHKRGISVCLDFVMNHTSEDHEWAKRAKAGEKEFQDRYFFYDNWDIPNQFEQTVPQVFPVTAPGNFSWCQEAGKVVMTTFYPYQWDLNYANPVVFNDMTDNMLNLCNHGVDIIRLDAVPYIWKQLGTNCRNLPQVHNMVRMMRMVTEIVCPGTLLLGEVVMEPSKVVPYFGSVEKPECHLLYNVTTMATIWHTVATQDVRLLSHQMEQVFSLPKEYTFLNYLRCHDDIGWGLDYPFLSQFGQSEVPHKKYLNDFLTGRWPLSFARGELYNDDPRLGDARLCGTTASLCGIEAALDSDNKEALDKAITLDTMLHAFMFTLSGVPVLYSGDEIAQENDYSYHDNPLKAEDSRYLHRGNLDWDKAARRKKRGTVESKVFKNITKLEQLRDTHRAFDSTADTWLEETGNPSVIGIGRYFKGEKIVSYFNFSDRMQSIWLLKPEKYKNLMTGRKHSLPYTDIEPFNFKWFSAEEFV